MKKTAMMLVSLAAALLTLGGCHMQTTQEKQLQRFIADHLDQVRPLSRQLNLAAWRAANSGQAEDFDEQSRLELQLRQIYSNPEEYAFLDGLSQSGRVRDPLLVRQLDQLRRGYLANQIDPDLLEQIVNLDTQIQKNFSTFRGRIGDRTVTDNEIRAILKSETDSARRQAAWEASKQVAPVVAADLRRLIKLRNRVARKLGYDNYHAFSLALSELDVGEIDAIFDELDELTGQPFAALKADIDRRLAQRCGIAPEQVTAWHYHDPFFQESPQVFDLDLDRYYESRDVRELATRFYAGIDLPVESVLERSDLYEREGKNPHAFCTDIDREGDVRILCNLKNNEQWMGTQLHELGHAVYDVYQDPETPFVLREPAHIFTTEAVAMFFGRLSRNARWMQQMMELTDAQRAEIETVSRRYARSQQLIFARWTLVMYHFEKQLYADPDQDLNALWWQLVERYQRVKKPVGRTGPDWAAKIHFAIAPCYYHNYMLGELLASQMHHYVAKTVLKSDSPAAAGYVDRPAVGRYFRRQVFEPGARYRWDEMIRRATGEPLTAAYFAEEFVN